MGRIGSAAAMIVGSKGKIGNDLAGPSKSIKRIRSGKYCRSKSGYSYRLTYEMANAPETIGDKKGFLSYNSCNH